MIILDTNILWGMALRGSTAELLRAIRASTVERVAVPWLVMEELAAKQALAYLEKHQAAEEALRHLKRATPWGRVQGPGACDLERVRAHWREEYGHLVEVLVTKDELIREGAYREANQIAPCRTVRSNGKDYKIGARDAAIWLTAIDYAEDHDDEMVFFVSGNTTDFGDGSSLPLPMAGDIANIADRFQVLTSLDGLISRFTKPAEVDTELVEKALRSHQSVMAVRALVDSPAAFTHSIACSVAPARGITAATTAGMFQWYGTPEVELDSVWDVSAHRIGTHVWCTATARWLCHGFGNAFGTPGTAGTSVIGAAWETRVLLSLTHAEPELTFLRHEGPTALRPRDGARLPSLMPNRPTPEDGVHSTTEMSLLLVLAQNGDRDARDALAMRLRHRYAEWHPEWLESPRATDP
ncbi:PIN domain-containing protein [Streptomyces sp. NPDC058548]|uniref:PIN domain-containing protein n=1 Tax=Streptomyces sp. NPDC058548 TaxID=3346545 RepID=UPI003652A975